MVIIKELFKMLLMLIIISIIVCMYILILFFNGDVFEVDLVVFSWVFCVELIIL